MRNQEVDTETCQKSANFDYVDSSAVGSVTGAYLVEQWEAAGVPGASHFLHKLGLSETQQIDVASLIALLSDELKLINDDKSRSSLDPSTAILSAISVLQNIHVQSLKSLIEHMNAEKDKLRNDVIEANQRALLLAQEIDDHHSKLEHSAQQQVKTLEQRHTEKIRELTLQLKSEQDAQATHTSQLEKKVSTLEEERNKCKSVIMQLELENKTLEHEHRVVTDQLANLQRIKEKLEADLEALSNLQMRATEMQAKVNNSEIMSLLERINVLESENTNLRDRNDELSTEVEELSTKLHNACIKKRSSPVNSSSFCADESMDEGAFPGGGTKRRGDSFGGMDSAEDSGDDEGSPRLGKVRKCSPVKDYASAANCLEGLQIHGVDQGESLEDDSPLRIPSSTIPEEVLDGKTQLNEVEEKMKILEERFNSIDGSHSKELMGHVKDIVNALRGRAAVCEGCSASEKKLQEREEEIARCKAEMEEKTMALGERCKNLETSLELMKVEYEKTEDYWAEKLEEERSFFEEEQKVSDKKYAELIDKIIEYEEMLGTEREQRQRLETIDEKDGFEKQVMDLEQECFELRSQFTNALKEKESEIERLKEEIRLAKTSGDLHDASVQVSEVSSGELTELESLKKVCDEPTKKPKVSSRRSSTFSSGDRKSRCCSNCQTPRSAELRPFQESKKQLEREIETLVKERDRVYKEIMDKRRDLNTYTCSGDSLSNKFIEMEDKCHSLMATLRHQQKQTEEILKNTWKQHKTEVGDLKSVLKMTEEKLKRQTEMIQEQFNKLARTDLIVKELFVENAFLVSSVQKLEKQCHTGKADEYTV
ncbi:UNVERIFIED_CONTAM: hypothetical protein PYX00_009823 [Menopon gallinae]|uniref:Uncharacterized protein n=1 Tax=Menopon gallinae TaxID=328185 RepID=A0AAW2HD36_9NEOP